MTPRFGFLKRTTLGLTLTSGLALGCGGPAPAPEIVAAPTVSARAQAPDVTSLDRAPTVIRQRGPEFRLKEAVSIEESLARLEALEILDVTDVVTRRTQHTWIPYGGFWGSHEVEMENEEVASRLQQFVEVAEEAAQNVPETIGDDTQGLCFPAGEASFCLTIDQHEAHLAALNDLEIVDVAGIVGDEADLGFVCYSSWYTVTENECRRALKAEAIVEATRDFASRRTPTGSGE